MDYFLALACPFCAGTKIGGSNIMIVIGIFLLLPAVLVAIIIAILRKVRNEESSSVNLE